MKYSEIKELARSFRKNPTSAEKLLWEEIRRRTIGGYKFHRQYPIIYEARNGEYFFYIPDFYCPAKKLVIELGGKIHDYQRERDRHRDEILKEMNLHILRIKNKELGEMEKVIDKIYKVLSGLP
jgi:leucyl-tRNA synthetase